MGGVDRYLFVSLESSGRTQNQQLQEPNYWLKFWILTSFSLLDSYINPQILPWGIQQNTRTTLAGNAGHGAEKVQRFSTKFIPTRSLYQEGILLETGDNKTAPVYVSWKRLRWTGMWNLPKKNGNSQMERSWLMKQAGYEILETFSCRDSLEGKVIIT